MKLSPEHASKIRAGLEPETQVYITEARPGEIELASIAISLKRIADALEKFLEQPSPIDPSSFKVGGN